MRFTLQRVFGWIVIAVAGLASVSGCTPQVEVTQDPLLQRIDKALGEADVKRRRIDLDRAELARDMEIVREKKLNAGVRLELLEKKQIAAESDLDKIRQWLARVQPITEVSRAAGKIELNGKEVSGDRLDRMAAELGSRAKSKESELKGLQTCRVALQRSAELLASQEQAALDSIQKLDQKIAQIRDPRVALDAGKGADKLAGDVTLLTDKFIAIGKEIDELFIEVESRIRADEAKLQDLQSQTLAADHWLTEPGSDLDATINEIEEILGSAGGN